MNFLDKLISLFYYIRILIAPILLSLIISILLFIYIFKGSIYGYIFGAIINILGIFYGIYFAEFARKNSGTLNFMGFLMHNKEFDNKNIKTK